MYIVIFLQKYMWLQWYCPYTSFFIGILYNLNGPVVIALPLASKYDAQSSIHIRILKKI